ncbi:hypothetical protein WKI13_15295 [Teredinibacter turnerae]|uniref:hypothetical protein n=1 Tax=Teredinibacter turnerae TaxID=2426 RepID=UPI000371ECCE|nr:hypothetical protein [Teredinibacter turnerae]
MSRIKKAKKLLEDELSNCYQNLDIEIGKSKRYARDNDFFEKGDSVKDVVILAIQYSEILEGSIHKIHKRVRKSGFLGREKFDQEYSRFAAYIFEKFKDYSLAMLEEISLVKGQKHLYGQNYPELQQSLDSALTGIINIKGE